jgi:hypothetical protein
MKQFLLDQLTNFTQDAVTEFQLKMIGPLPRFTIPDVYNELTTIWGHTDQGFWYTNKLQAYGFEHTGTIHTAGIVRHAWYYELYNIMYGAGCNVLVPIEFIENIGATDHIDVVHYTKFNTPANEYNMSLDALTYVKPGIDVKPHLKKYVDQIGQCFYALCRANRYHVPICDFTNFAIGRSQSYFMFFNEFQPCDNVEYGVTMLLNVFATMLNDRIFNNMSADDKESIQQYAREIWYKPILEKLLDQKLSELVVPDGMFTEEHKDKLIEQGIAVCLPLTI